MHPLPVDRDFWWPEPSQLICLELELVGDQSDALVHVERVGLVLRRSNSDPELRSVRLARIEQDQSDSEDHARRVETGDVFGL
jgi:hypothetical protein